MAERSISYGIGLSDQMINQMLQSDDPNIVAQAQEYVNTAQEQQPQKTGILQKIGNFFFPSAASAEPDFNVITGQPNTATNQFPFRSMADMAAANQLALNQIYSTPAATNTQSGFATNFPTVSPASGITQSTVGQTFEPPFVMAGGQKFALGDPRIAEQRNYFTRPTGIMTQAKNFFTQTAPSILSSAVNLIPGVRFMRGLDKFNTLPYQDRKFIESRMTGTTPGFYVDPNTGALKDKTGIAVRSLFGNYAERVDKEYDRYSKAIERAEDKYDVTWDGNKFVGPNAKKANYMNKFNIGAFKFYEKQKDDRQAQQRDLLDKIAAQVKAGATAKKGTALHGGTQTSGGDGGGSGGYTPSISAPQAAANRESRRGGQYGF